MPTGVWFAAASNWTMTGCEITNYTVNGVLVDNTNSADSGDSCISGCLFNTSSTGNGIKQNAGGGLKITNCKFLGGDRGYVLSFNGAINTGDLMISNCSFEGFGSQAIALTRTSGTSTFGHICITGNQIAGTPQGIATDASGALYDIAITGNQFSINSVSGQGMALNNIDNFNISCNTIRGFGGTSSGISWTSCTNGMISHNQIVGCASNVTPGSGSVVVLNNPT
jgi:hypothetical protein